MEKTELLMKYTMHYLENRYLYTHLTVKEFINEFLKQIEDEK
jgi:hypothetical protein